jgi:hypothetical protein
MWVAGARIGTQRSKDTVAMLRPGPPGSEPGKAVA